MRFILGNELSTANSGARVSFRGPSPPLPLANTLSLQLLPLHWFAIPAGVAFVLVFCGVDRELTVGFILAGCLRLLTHPGVEVSADHRDLRETIPCSVGGGAAGNRFGVTMKYFSELVPPPPRPVQLWNLERPAPARPAVGCAAVGEE